MQADGVRLIPLEDDATLIPSTLYAPRPRDQLDDDTLELTSEVLDQLKFGEAALEEYLLEPTEGYFVKSPKSFLGAPGITEEIKGRFITVVAAMMANVKRFADADLPEPVDQVVIGRPINFQGAGGEAENQQALQMLVAAAREAGFEEIRFLYEPMAAAMEYEARLQTEECVLVLDIGGGTTDCSFVRVGPERRALRERENDILGHAGERLGGNDYDQLLGLIALSPQLGYGKILRSGLPVPNNYFVDAVSTNDVNAQQRFFSARMKDRLRQCAMDGVPEVSRLCTLQEGRMTYRFMQSAELAKITLTDWEQAEVNLSYIEQGLCAYATRAQLRESCDRLLVHLDALVREVVTQAGSQPDVVYLTGGMAKSAVVRTYLRTVLPNMRTVDSDHFASVTEGLTLWAERVYD
ncbi:MAG: molecular chaperone [Gammaproteobacteria bacterium]|nr:molecular chaperone [Gammaproteobacteria bacterium]